MRSQVNAGPDPRYQFTSKKLDAETSLYYFGARYYDAWSGRFNSIDPHADLYHSWSPYVYSLDNPVLLVDQTGMDPGNNNNQGNQSTSNWNWQFGPNGTYVFFQNGTSNQGTPSNAFSSQQVQEVQQEFKYYTKQVESGGKSLLNFAQETASAAHTTYFWAGTAAAAGAVVAGYFGQAELSEPLAESAASSWSLAFYSEALNTTMSFGEMMAGTKSPVEFLSEAAPTDMGAIGGRFIDVAPISTQVVGKLLENQSNEALSAWIKSLDLQPTH